MLFSLLSGTLLFGIALAYLYKPQFIIKTYSFLRNSVFTDSSILLYRKKIGVASLALAIIVLYSAIYAFLKVNLTDDRSAEFLAELTLQRGLADFSAGKYKKAGDAAEKILAGNPRNVRALMLAGSSSLVLNDREKARRYWKTASSLEPYNAVIKSALKSLPPEKKQSR